jgi:hypothetical protein
MFGIYGIESVKASCVDSQRDSGPRIGSESNAKPTTESPGLTQPLVAVRPCDSGVGFKSGFNIESGAESKSIITVLEKPARKLVLVENHNSRTT